MSDKPKIPSWQRASADKPSTSTEANVAIAPTPTEDDVEQSERSTSTTAVAPTPTEDDLEERDSTSLLDQARRFLEDPSIRDAPQEKKTAFLEAKGVHARDIEALLGEVSDGDKPVNLEEAGERAWSTTPPKPVDAMQIPPQPREIPPIVTYPEFLAQTEQPPPLITTQRLLKTAYVTGGLMATLYGFSKYIVAPMTQNLTEARHDFAEHTQEQLKELNKRLADTASVDPATKVKKSADILDDVSEADSDPTELYHRDYGTQTTPDLSRRPSVASPNDPEPVVTGHENRLKIIKSHLQELEATHSNDNASADSLKTKVSDLTTYLSEMSYLNQYSNMGGLYGSTYGLPAARDGKNDQIEAFKSDIRAVKGVFLSARNFPTGGRNSPTMPTGRLFDRGTLSNFVTRYQLKMTSWAPKLPFGQHKEEHKDENSLTTLLTADQCAELTFLIATITATMRKSLLQTFTAEEVQPDAKISKTDEDALRNAPSDLEDVDVAKEDKVKKERELREQEAKKELAQPEVQELKKEMLQYFDEWRGKVVSRVGEIVNSREQAKEQTKHVGDKQVQDSVKAAEIGTTSITSLNAKYDEDEEKAFQEIYPGVSTQLSQLEESKRALILHSLVLILLSLEHYSAHSRILILHLTSSLGLPLSVLKKDEETVAQGLLEAASQQLNADAETKKAADASQTARKWKVGLASVAGAALIGVTGGLAAPLLAAGVGSVMGGIGLGATAAAGYLGTLAGSSVLVGGLFGAYGARMTGRAMDDYAREVEDFAFIPIHRSQDPKQQDNESRRLRVAIAVSGWLRDPEEVSKPWRYIGKGTEGFALRWELEALIKLGHSLETFVTSAAWGYAKKKIIEQTVFATLTAALWPLGLLKIASMLDNPFSVAKRRAEKAGEVLADALINKVQGERPVTLVGYSLGARLIYSCCQKLAERRAFGLIENVVLLGAPCPSDVADWRRIRSVVSGRVVNVFSKQDFILGFLYRTSSVQLGVAGLQPVVGVHGVQNVDVSELVDGHLQYRYLTGSILRKIGFEDVDIKEVERAEAEMKKQQEEEKKEREKNEGKSGSEEGEDKEKLEKEVQKKNDQSMWQLMQEKTKGLDIGGFLGGGNSGDAKQPAEKSDVKTQQQQQK
ncbi:hypothetical protein FB567DRAFT_438450 [Paraphoma chrysanthemicola]|uniref:Peroxisome membrane anchor protein Pex14p N-terminal domain-containing protein n=1 Tax=Paraphoma chrysanthemicola TaxID=798071 RepID=A0A8K0R953_9PLEO|nr:hypothetical protein FB567DRAFT_438450 [Paraphoma chrysanthemicola]